MPAVNSLSHTLSRHLLAGLAALALAGAAHGNCLDEEKLDALPAMAAPGTPPPPPPVAPRAQLQQLVGDALARNHGVGAARLLAEAAEQDVGEAEASKKPQAMLTGSINPGLESSKGGNSSSLQARAGITLSQTLYDGGRADRLVDWRRQQAEAARLGMLSTQEQIALATVSMAFERSRFRMQAVIYSQNVRKLGCLVQALETIVAADKGRTSELVQARKQLQQAELQQVQAQSQARQVEARMRRTVGDGLPGTDGMATLLLAVPELPQVLSAAEKSVEISQLAANARALTEIARVVEAGNRPQVSWNVGGSALLSAGGGVTLSSPRSANLSAGVTLSVPILNPAIEYSSQAARKRAAAADLQRADALEQRRQRIVDVHEQAGAAFDRLKRVGLVLRDSDRLRNFTLQQWQQMGRRSLFDVLAAEGDHYNLRVQYVNALHDGQQMNAVLTSLGTGLSDWLK
jgi:outer membrane protein TolC